MKKGRPVIRIGKDGQKLIIDGYSMTLRDAKDLAHEILDQVEYVELWPKKRHKK